MDFEKMWYTLKQYLIEKEEIDVLIAMNEIEVAKVLGIDTIKEIVEEKEEPKIEEIEKETAKKVAAVNPRPSKRRVW